MTKTKAPIMHFSYFSCGHCGKHYKTRKSAYLCAQLDEFYSDDEPCREYFDVEEGVAYV